MIYTDFKGKKLSLLGFGTMRLPLLNDDSGRVDEEQVFRMVRYANDHGVNYYDTAYPYHNSTSEIIVGKALKQLPRESYYLADKYPGHQIAKTYDPAATFEEQLKKCGTDYFDFYLLHNVYESSLSVYTDPKWGIIDYFIEQRRLGRIKHLGFSTHALLDTLTAFLDSCGDIMEFCQIQLNYLDWTLQDAKAKYDLLTERNIPIWVMEPLRGGKLAGLDEAASSKLRSLRPDESTASWAFRWLMTLPNVKMILSGMSSMEQMTDNIHTFETDKPLTKAECDALLKTADSLKNDLPCTACRYCCSDCPQKLDIPGLLSLYNEMRFSPGFNVGMTIDSFAEDKRPSACISCGSCANICPQKIDVPGAMEDFTRMLDKVPHWADMCREREEAARKLREQQAKNAEWREHINEKTS